MKGGAALNYVNVSQPIGNVISLGLATIPELSTSLSTEDVYILLEIGMIDRHNEAERERET